MKFNAFPYCNRKYIAFRCLMMTSSIKIIVIIYPFPKRRFMVICIRYEDCRVRFTHTSVMMIGDYSIHTCTHFSSGLLPVWIAIVALVNFRRNITSGPTMYSKLVIHAQFKFIYTRAFRQSASVRTRDLWPIRTCAAVRPIASRRSVFPGREINARVAHFDDERRRPRRGWSGGGLSF